MFKIIRLSLGRIKAGSKHTLIFPYFDVEKIIAVKTSCDCVDITNDIPNQQLRASYKAKSIPIQLKHRNQNSMDTNKTITVEYFKKGIPIEKKVVVLSFNATIYE